MNIHSLLNNAVVRSWNECTIDTNKLIYPIFVHNESDIVISGFEPNKRWSVNAEESAGLIEYLHGLVNIGLKSVLIFGIVPTYMKNSTGSYADDINGPIILALKLLKENFPSLLLAVDVCLCEYTDSGHCCMFDNSNNIDNTNTVNRLATIALEYCKAGAQLICPSDMMDGRIKAIRTILDSNNYRHIPIMSYTSKKASSMYSPFRNAVCSTFTGNRNQYQHPVGSSNIAMKALERDINEGADFVVIKPSLFYGDIIKRFAEQTNSPIVCYVVSGEYNMIKMYGEQNNNVIDVILESHISLIRSGASILITYFVPEILNHLTN